jgi:nicotinate-nucleotide adenylyltransferase
VTGLLGGAFDPPHNGHVALARAALDRFGLDRLVVVPTGDPPHKHVRTPAELRYRLAEAAFDGLPGVELSRRELEHPGPSYTVDTVRWAAERWGDVVFVVGADHWASFDRWHDPEGVLRHARLAVVARPGVETPPTRDRVELFAMTPVEISSTEVRERVARGEPIDDLVPPRVAALIAELGLYGPDRGTALATDRLGAS